MSNAAKACISNTFCVNINDDDDSDSSESDEVFQYWVLSQASQFNKLTEKNLLSKHKQVRKGRKPKSVKSLDMSSFRSATACIW